MKNESLFNRGTNLELELCGVYTNTFPDVARNPLQTTGSVESFVSTTIPSQVKNITELLIKKPLSASIFHPPPSIPPPPPTHTHTRSHINISLFFHFSSHHLIYPLTARVVGAPQMISRPVFSIFSLFSTALWDLPNSRPVHSLMFSSHLFLCLP